MKPSISAFDFLKQRRSVAAARLVQPAPDRDSLQQIVQTALSVPDHGRLTPWRIIEIAAPDRPRFAAAIDARHRDINPEVSSTKLDKDHQRFAGTPLLLVVVACIRPGHKVPEQEQMLSAGCVCLTLLQAAQALGFAGQWLTGWAAYDAGVAQLLGLNEHERVLGFIHLGSVAVDWPDATLPARPQADLTAHFGPWRG